MVVQMIWVWTSFNNTYIYIYIYTSPVDNIDVTIFNPLMTMVAKVGLTQSLNKAVLKLLQDPQIDTSNGNSESSHMLSVW